MSKKRVYVSATYGDLIDHRAAVKTALERAQFDVECMEKYPAFDERPADKCLADVAQCDYYVLILALRYGFQPPKGNPKKKSITQMEYEEAVRLKKPCLAFLLDEIHPWPAPYVDANALKPRSKIGAFRKQVGLAHGVNLFTTPESLASAVQQALRALELRGTKESDDGGAAIRAGYLDWLRRTCESVELLGLDLKETQNVRLGQVYVPAVTAGRAAERRQAPQGLADLFSEHRLDLLPLAGACGGKRHANVTHLEWSQVDLARKTVWVPGDKTKNRKALAVPLSDKAVAILGAQSGKHPMWVFVKAGKPVHQTSTRAWRGAVAKAAIQDFCWHDLRHTWASWHVQNGTPLNVLQELGGWSSFRMVQRYAHLSSEHLRSWVDRPTLVVSNGETRTGTAG